MYFVILMYVSILNMRQLTEIWNKILRSSVQLPETSQG